MSRGAFDKWWLENRGKLKAELFPREALARVTWDDSREQVIKRVLEKLEEFKLAPPKSCFISSTVIDEIKKLKECFK